MRIPEHQARWETQPLPVQHSLHPHTETQMISNFLETEEATRSSDTLSCPTATEAKFKPTAAQKPQVYTAFPNLPMQINNATGSWRRRPWPTAGCTEQCAPGNRRRIVFCRSKGTQTSRREGQSSSTQKTRGQTTLSN